MSFADVSLGADAPVALVDLGDTLADCTPMLRVALAHLRSPGEHQRDESLVPLPPYLEARCRTVMSTPGFWRDLAPRAQGFALLALIRDAGFRVNIVTKGPYNAPQVWAEKVAWCRVHLPDVPVIVTDDKSRVHGHLLVDDWIPYVESWQHQWQAGLAIIPAQPWNVHAPVGPRCVRDTGSERDALVAALRNCRDSAHR